MRVKYVHPVRVQHVQPVDEGRDALLQGVQRVVLGVVLPQVVPQAPQSVSEQLNLLSLLAEQKQKNPLL